VSSHVISRVTLPPANAHPWGVLPERDADGHARVAQLVSPGFDRYVRIFHPVLDGDPQKAEEPLTPRRSWASLAQEAGVAFDAELSQLSLGDVQAPYWISEGNLDEPARSSLFRLLDHGTRTVPVFFLYELGAVSRGGTPMLFAGPLPSFAEAQAMADADVGEWVPGPEFLWPADRSWVVISDYDISSTYVGCSAALAHAILADPNLEALPVSLATLVVR
jgi:hypothetical protein